MKTLPVRPRVAFLGLGLMGIHMASRLLTAGFPLAIFNRTVAKAASLVAGGARLAVTPRDAADGADIIISMLADDDASRGSWLGTNGALAGAKPGAVAVESSTVTVEWISELKVAARSRDCSLLDAPVTGSTPQAKAGELKFLVGGDASALALARQALDAMGSLVVHVGPTGCGARLKLINNFLVGVQAASLAEAVAMIERGGLHGSAAMDVILEGAVGSPMVKRLAARIAAGDQTLNFPLKLMVKDLVYSRQEATALGLELQTAKAAQRIFEAAVKRGDADRDMSAVFNQFRMAAGLEGKSNPSHPA